MSDIVWRTTEPIRQSRHADLPDGMNVSVYPLDGANSVVVVRREHYGISVTSEVKTVVPDRDVDGVIPKLVDIAKTIPTRLP